MKKKSVGMLLIFLGFSLWPFNPSAANEKTAANEHQTKIVIKIKEETEEGPKLLEKGTAANNGSVASPNNRSNRLPQTGEQPSNLSLAGGMIVLIVLIYQGRRERKNFEKH